MAASLIVFDTAATFTTHNVYQYALPTGALPVAPGAVFAYNSTVNGIPLAGCQDKSGNSFFLLNDIGSSGTPGALKVTPAGVVSFYVSMPTLTVGTLGNGASIAADESGNVYVMPNDGSGEVWRYTSAGIRSTFTTAADIGFGWALAFNAAGNLIVAGSNTITGNDTLVSVSPAGVATTLNANILATATICSNICFDDHGNIYLLTTQIGAGGRVAKFSPAGAPLTDPFIDMLAGAFTSYSQFWLAFDPGALVFYVGSQIVCVAFDESGNVLAPATLLTSIAGPYNITATSNRVKLAMDGAAPITFTLTNGAARTALQIAGEINAAMGAPIATVSTGKILITSLNATNDSEIDFQGGIANSAYTKLGITPTRPIPGGNISTPNFAGPTQFFFNNILALAGPTAPAVVPTRDQPLFGSFVSFFGAQNFGGGTS